MEQDATIVGDAGGAWGLWDINGVISVKWMTSRPAGLHSALTGGHQGGDGIQAGAAPRSGEISDVKCSLPRLTFMLFPVCSGEMALGRSGKEQNAVGGLSGRASYR